MIRAGQISREEALKRVSNEELGEEPEVLGGFIEQLNLTTEDVNIAKHKNHLDFF